MGESLAILIKNKEPIQGMDEIQRLYETGTTSSNLRSPPYNAINVALF